MSLVTPYCTVSEATTYLGESETWDDAELTEKESALFWGRMYIDSQFRCVEFDEDDLPDELIYANALLAEDYLQGTLISDTNKITGAIKKKRSKAGWVETEVEYLGGAVNKGAQDDVIALLHEYCTKRGSTKIITRV